MTQGWSYHHLFPADNADHNNADFGDDYRINLRNPRNNPRLNDSVGQERDLRENYYHILKKGTLPGR